MTSLPPGSEYALLVNGGRRKYQVRLSCTSEAFTALDAHGGMSVIGCETLLGHVSMYHEIDAGDHLWVWPSDRSGNPTGSISALACRDSLLRVLDISRLKNLTGLLCSGNLLTQIDLTHNPRLARVICDENPLQLLNVSHLKELSYLSCKQARQLNVLDHYGTNPSAKVRGERAIRLWRHFERSCRDNLNGTTPRAAALADRSVF